ncbi:MAG: PilT/PilU family type 4a pilus ATPase [Proteobacteria bacterium]|nr:PilT/PilU family type 4a pilus ATPase [Pseudomonadota bacterium]
MYLDQAFTLAFRGKASDILIKVGLPIKFRYLGQIVTLKGSKIVTEKMIDDWVEVTMPDFLKPVYEEKGDVDFAFQDKAGIRFRVNIFRQNSVQGFVARVLQNYIRSVEELQLPSVLNTIPQFKGGLIFVTGTTGSGKSTTLAAIVQKMNTDYPFHVMTIEDPIEYVYEDEKSIINQREVGVDTKSFTQGLRGALRQNPDVIVLGELRDREAAYEALKASETGILVMTTLHTCNAVESLNRFLSFFPTSDREILADFLSRNIRMCISQRLLPTADRKSMIVASEIMVANQRVKEIIKENQSFQEIYDVIEASNESYRMHSFDQSLIYLLKKGYITEQHAVAHATSPTNLQVMLSGVG